MKATDYIEMSAERFASLPRYAKQAITKLLNERNDAINELARVKSLHAVLSDRHGFWTAINGPCPVDAQRDLLARINLFTLNNGGANLVASLCEGDLCIIARKGDK